METTGIAAGIALVGALTGELGGKAVRKAFVYFVKKVGKRVLGGIGLALMAIDFTICMAADGDKMMGTSNTCEDILQAKTLRSNTTIFISKNDIDNVQSDSYALSIKENTSYQIYNISYGYTPILIQNVTEDTPCIVKKNIGKWGSILGKNINLNSIKQYERFVFDDIIITDNNTFTP